MSNNQDLFKGFYKKIPTDTAEETISVNLRNLREKKRKYGNTSKRI